jgi:uncharacterized protein (TIGR03435 family)
MRVDQVFMNTLFLAVAATAVLAQSAAPIFEVASIKQNKSGATGGAFGGPPSRFTATNTPAQAFITYAFRVQDFQIEGAPDWVTNDRWDVNAKADGNSPATTIDGNDARREMVRALLIDRFRMSVHKETRERPIYALVLARLGQVSARLHPSTTDCAALENASRVGQNPRTPPMTPDSVPDCTIRDPPGRISWGTQTMQAVASVLLDSVQRPVVDRTGLEGNFSALVTYRPDSGPDQPDPNATSIFTALQEQLGLRLDSTRGPVEVLVIDHIERPAEN